jgi:hypothetical protein
MSCRIYRLLGRLLSSCPCNEKQGDSDDGCDVKTSDQMPPIAGGVPGMTARELRYIMDRAGVSVAKVAAALSVSPRTVSRWRSGASGIDYWKAQDIRRRWATWEATESLAAKVRRGRLLAKLDDEEKG